MLQQHQQQLELSLLALHLCNSLNNQTKPNNQNNPLLQYQQQQHQQHQHQQQHQQHQINISHLLLSQLQQQLLQPQSQATPNQVASNMSGPLTIGSSNGSPLNNNLSNHNHDHQLLSHDQQQTNFTGNNNNAAALDLSTASSLANLISLSAAAAAAAASSTNGPNQHHQNMNHNQLQSKQFIQQASSPRQLQYDSAIGSPINSDTSTLLARLTSSLNPTPQPPTSPYPIHTTTCHINNNTSNLNLNPNINSNQRLLESLYTMNDQPEDEAIDLIAQRINSTYLDVSNWFQLRRESDRSLYDSSNASNNNNNIINHNNSNIINNTSNNCISSSSCQPPTVPSSTLLAKLNSVTTRANSHITATKLDQKMTDLLEAFYAINDNPEPTAIEMIAKRINTTVEAIGDWFDEKRMRTNPHAGQRSPLVKKREGGRVVTFSEYQRSLLEAIFDENNYLHPQEYEELSNLIQVPSRNIKIWFKNRRSKQRLSGRITTPH